LLSQRREDAKGRRGDVKFKGGFARRRGGAEARRKDDKKLKVKGGCSREGAKTLRDGEGIRTSKAIVALGRGGDCWKTGRARPGIDLAEA